MSRRLRRVRQLAEQGIPSAQAILGAFYSKGIGVPKDDNLAFRWYLKAADQGCISAQVIVGTRYALGVGVVQNYMKARRWFYEAARRNNIRAEIALVMLQKHGTCGS